MSNNKNNPDLSHLSSAFAELVKGKKPPAGQYLAKVVSTEINNSQKGRLQVMYTLEIMQPESNYDDVRKFTPLSGDKLSFIIGEMKLFKEPLPNIQYLPQSLKNIVNAIVTVEITYSDDEGYTDAIPRFIKLVAKPVPGVADEDAEILMANSGAQDQETNQS
jgi:hypothetical protein